VYIHPTYHCHFHLSPPPPTTHPHTSITLPHQPTTPTFSPACSPACLPYLHQVCIEQGTYCTARTHAAPTRTPTRAVTYTPSLLHFRGSCLFSCPYSFVGIVSHASLISASFAVGVLEGLLRPGQQPLAIWLAQGRNLPGPSDSRSNRPLLPPLNTRRRGCRWSTGGIA
jgi:hypothetical protein